MPNPTIYIATVSHKHGTNVYAAQTHEGMVAQVAKYCREEWDETEMDAMPENDHELIERYFSYVAGEEYWDDDTAELLP